MGPKILRYYIKHNLVVSNGLSMSIHSYWNLIYLFCLHRSCGSDFIFLIKDTSLFLYIIYFYITFKALVRNRKIGNDKKATYSFFFHNSMCLLKLTFATEPSLEGCASRLLPPSCFLSGCVRACSQLSPLHRQL